MKLKANTRLPSLAALRTLEVAARSKSFSAAADELFVTPGAVSRQIRLLEEEIGVTFFGRTANAVEINNFGRRFAAQLSQAFAIISDAVEGVRLKSGGEIRVSSAPTIATKLLANWLNDYAVQHNDISIALDATDRLVNLERHEADLAVRFIPTDAVPASARLLVNEILIPVCSPDYYETNGPWSVPEDLLTTTLLHAEWAARGRSPVPGWVDWFARFATASHRIPAGVQLGLLGLAVHEARKDRGVALGPKALVAEDLKRGELMAPFGEDYQLPIPWSYCIAWAENRPLSPAQTNLVNWICDRAAQSFRAS